MSIYFAELKCPQQHIVAGVAGEYPDDAQAVKLIDILKTQVTRAGISRNCPKCDEYASSIEVGETSFLTVQAFYEAAQQNGFISEVLTRRQVNAGNN